MRAKTITLDMITDDVSKRFTSKYEESDDCWLWLAGKTVGYGVITINGSQYKAHRVAYLMGHGEIDEKMVIDHLCNNRACVKPTHLIQTTNSDNIHNSDHFCNEEYCPKGHTNFCYSSGTRYCRDCRNEHQRNRYRTDPDYRKRKLMTTTL